MQESPNVLLKTVAVPGWIYRALLRAKRSTADLTNYSVLREVLSVDDFAQWFYVNQHLKIDNQYMFQFFDERFFEGLSPAQALEIKNSVAPLAFSEEIASSVKTRLSTEKEDWQVSPTDVDYNFVLLDNTIFVILHEGFLKNMTDAQKRYAFVQEYLKKCYAMTSIADVSKMAAFRSYVNHLAN